VNEGRFIELRDTDVNTFQCLQEVFPESAVSAPILLLEEPREQISIGQKAIVDKAVHLDFCEANDIPIVRSPFPHSSSMYCCGQALKGLLAIALESPLMTDVEVGKKLVIESLIASLDNLSLTASFLPRSNNITVGEKKILPIISRIHQNVLLFGFTLLLDFNYDRAEKVLISKKDMRENLTTIRKELGRDVTFDEVKNALKQGFRSVLAIEFLDDELTKEEIRKAEEAREKYLSETWVKYGRWSSVKEYERPE